MHKNNLTKGIITVNFFLSYLVTFYQVRVSHRNFFQPSGSGIKIFSAADPYTDPVFFAADPDAQISGALPLKQRFKSAPTYKIQVGFGRAAPTCLFKLVDTQKWGAARLPPPFSLLLLLLLNHLPPDITSGQGLKKTFLIQFFFTKTITQLTNNERIGLLVQMGGSAA
jgi:hypothetical protein